MEETGDQTMLGMTMLGGGETFKELGEMTMTYTPTAYMDGFTQLTEGDTRYLGDRMKSIKQKRGLAPGAKVSPSDGMSWAVK